MSYKERIYINGEWVDDYLLDASIKDEIESATSVNESQNEEIANLSSSLEGEISNRETADIAIKEKLNNEVTDRTAADSELQSQIDEISTTVNSLPTIEITDALDQRISTNEESITTINSKLATAEGKITTNEASILANSSDIATIKSNYSLISETGSKINVDYDSIEYKLTISLLDKNNNILGESYEIDLPLETMVVGASYADGDITLTLTNNETISFSVAALVDGLVDQDTFDGLKTRVSTNESNISSLQTQVSTNTSDIATNKTNIAINASAISDEITNRENADSALEEKITTNTSSISDLSSKIDTNSTNIATNTSNISDLKTDVNSNTTSITTISNSLSSYELSSNKVTSISSSDSSDTNYPSTSAVITYVKDQINSIEITGGTGTEVDLSDYVTVSTEQTISGKKTFNSDLNIDNASLTFNEASEIYYNDNYNILIVSNPIGFYSDIDTQNGDVISITPVTLSDDSHYVRFVANNNNTETIGVNSLYNTNNDRVYMLYDPSDGESDELTLATTDYVNSQISSSVSSSSSSSTSISVACITDDLDALASYLTNLDISDETSIDYAFYQLVTNTDSLKSIILSTDLSSLGYNSTGPAFVTWNGSSFDLQSMISDYENIYAYYTYLSGTRITNTNLYFYNTLDGNLHILSTDVDTSLYQTVSNLSSSISASSTNYPSNSAVISYVSSQLSSYVSSTSLISKLASYATTDDLLSYATISSLSDYVTNNSLTNTLADYATTDSLSDYVQSNTLSTTLSNYATTSNVSKTYQTLSNLSTSETIESDTGKDDKYVSVAAMEAYVQAAIAAALSE